MIARTMAMALGLIGAGLSSQLPEFTQQYRQRLGGAIDELQQRVDALDRDAARSGLTRDDALRQLAAGEAFARLRARSEADGIARLSDLRRQQGEMRDAGSFGRILVYLQQGDAALSNRTLDDFEPAVPATTEGIAAAAIGFLLGYFLIRAMSAPLETLARRRRLRRA